MIGFTARRQYALKNTRKNLMSCRGRVSVGIRGSEVSWWVKQCSDLPRRRRTPREALSFKCAQRDPHPSLNGCSAAVWTVGPFFFSAVGGMCFICQSRNTPGQPLSEACSSKIRAHTHHTHILRVDDKQIKSVWEAHICKTNTKQIRTR